MTTTMKRSFPKAIPFRAPEQLAAERDLWRRRTFGLVGLLTLIAVLTVGAVIYLNNRATRTPIVLATDVEEPSVTPPLAPAPVFLTAAPPVKIETPKPAPAKSAARLESTQKERFLEVLGSLSAAHLFQTYLNIGLLADGVESEAYSTDEAADTLQSITEVMDQVDSQLELLTKVGLDANDNAAIEQIKAVTVLLRMQSKYLQEYWTTGETARADQYHEVRKAAWKGLTKVLQLESK